MTARTATVRLPDLTVRYRTWGRADAPPLLLLHGLTSSGAAWEQVAKPLAEHWRVLAPDARGHGGSDRTGEYSFALFARDLADLIAALELDRPAVVGHSMGGIAASRYASRPGSRPRGLVLTETPPPQPIRRPLPPRPDEPLSYDYAARVAVIRELAEPEPGLWDRFADITAPSLVIGGGAESPFDQDAMASMARHIPGARFTTIPGGHGLPAAEPAALAAAVAEFLSTTIDLGANKT